MAISVVHSLQQTFSTNTNSPSLPIVTPTAGNLLVTSITIHRAGSTSNSPTPPPGFAQLRASVYDFSFHSSLYYKIADGTETALQFSGLDAQDTSAISYMEVSGADVLEDSANDNSHINSNTTAQNTGSAYPATPNGIAIASIGLEYYNWYNNISWTNGFTQVGNINVAWGKPSAPLAYKLFSATGEQTTTATSNAGIAKPAYGAIAVFKNVSGGSTIPVTSDLTIVWDTLQQVVCDQAVAFSILNAVDTDIALAWDMLNSITSDVAISYNLLLQITADLGVEWNILQAVNSDAQVAWDVLNQVTSDQAVSYSILQQAASDLDVEFSIVQQVNSDIAVMFDVQSALTQVVSDLPISWDVNSALTKVTSDLDISYSLLQKIESDLVAQWDLLNAVGVDLSLSWNVAQAVYADLLVNYDTLQNVQSDLTLSFDSLQATSSDLTIQFKVGDEQLVPITVIPIPAEQRVYAIPPEQRVYPVHIH